MDTADDYLNLIKQRDSSSLQGEINFARMLVYRLERMSADSHWTHWASGLRGGLLRVLDAFDTQSGQPSAADAIDPAELKALNDQGMDLLTKAAREMRGDDTK